MLLLRKGVYPCEYMDDWSRFDEEQLPDESDFYSGLNMDKFLELIIDMLKIYISRVIHYY